LNRDCWNCQWIFNVFAMETWMQAAAGLKFTRLDRDGPPV
jgi:hypothetical protein